MKYIYIIYYLATRLIPQACPSNKIGCLFYHCKIETYEGVAMGNTKKEVLDYATEIHAIKFNVDSMERLIKK